MNILTIFADASHIHQHGVTSSAWAVISHLGKMHGSKVCPKEITNITLAEMYAIAQAVYSADRVWKVKSFDIILIFTDSTEAIRYLNAKPTKKEYVAHRRLYEAFKKTVGEAHVILQHVKAHTGKPDKFSRINDFVDKAAKKTSRDYVQQKFFS